jgi:hypothetical protein
MRKKEMFLKKKGGVGITASLCKLKTIDAIEALENQMSLQSPPSLMS